ncbi:hypothetical protein BH18ACT12_BH18ACT12_13950 [soil metagenome]
MSSERSTSLDRLMERVATSTILFTLVVRVLTR